MDTVLHVLGAIGVVVLVLVVAAVVAVMIFIHRIRKALASLLSSSRSTSTPPRIHLQPAPDITWSDPQSIRDKCDQALKAGFTDLGSFTVSEMPGVKIQALAKASESAYCVVYEHPRVGVWSDMVTKYENGYGLTVSNSPRGGTLDVRPGQKKVSAKDLDVTGLYERMVQERGTETLMKLTGTASEFKQIFEQAYADEMDWRNSRGGATQDEIRRVAAETGRQVSDQTVGLAAEMKNKQACEGLITAFLEKLRANSKYSDAEWSNLSGRVIFVHERLPLDMVHELVARRTGVKTTFSKREDMTMRDAFASFNQTLDTTHRFEKIGELSEPIPADVYAVREADGVRA